MLVEPEVFERWKTACELKQTVDRAGIELALHALANEIGAPCQNIVFLETIGELKEKANCEAKSLSEYIHPSFRPLRGTYHNAYGIWAASAAGSTWTTIYPTGMNRVLCASEISWLIYRAMVFSRPEIWLRIIEAFEAGLYFIVYTASDIFVATVPMLVEKDDLNRLHCETGPAFKWLDMTLYYWHGVHVPSDWIMGRAQLTAIVVFSARDAELRRAGCEIIGWEKVLDQIDARLIDEDGDPQIGTLYEGQIPGADPCGFLKVTCGTGRTFVIPTPRGMRSAIEAQAWIQNVPTTDWVKPEVRG